MNLPIFPDLPNKVKVRIHEAKGGKYIADLIEYDVFTETKDLNKLPDLVNDLIYELFEIPKQYQKMIVYMPVEDKSKDFEKAKPFIMFSTPDFYKKYSTS